MRGVLESSLPSPFLEGHDLVVLRNGDEIFPAMIRAIERARRSIDFETFVYWQGDIAIRFAEALRAAAGRGIRVRVLLDGVGAIPMSQDVRDILEESEAEVRYFHPPKNLRFWELDQRTHRKILVCDDEGFTGGVGIADEWTGDARGPDEWRDNHFWIRGPVVDALQATFLGHWLETAGPSGGEAVRAELARHDGDGPAPTPPEGTTITGAPVQIVRSLGGNRWTDAHTLLRVLFASARDRIRIATAYFVPDEDLVRLLCDAAEDGVRVEIIHPGPHTDHRISQLGGESVYAPLLEAGVRIFRYQPTMFHTKAITVDGIVSTIGSANLNRRSTGKDDEIALVVLDSDFTDALDRQLEADLEHCHRVEEAQDWSERSLTQRIGEWFADLIRGQL
jgi:cardiolipin synthase